VSFVLLVLSKILFIYTSELFNIWLVYSSLYEPTKTLLTSSYTNVPTELKLGVAGNDFWNLQPKKETLGNKR